MVHKRGKANAANQGSNSKKRAAGPSMGLRLLLYRFIMVLLMAAILSTLMATGVLSHPAHQLSGTLDIQ